MPPVRFALVGDLAGLALNLGSTIDELQEIADASDQRGFYRRLQIPKKGRRRRGQFRTVYKPRQSLGLLQKNIGTWIATWTDFPECVQGFVQRRSTSSNAKVHLGQRHLLHADIKDFFETITVAQVEDAFSGFGCVPAVARTLARLCTLNGRLPAGSSASPALANLVCRHVDTDMMTLASAHECKYTRYADDLTFSGDTLPDGAAVRAILEKHGFRLREEGCRIQKRGWHQYVTGLSIADTASPRVPKPMKRRLRLELHYARRYGLQDHLDRSGNTESPLRALARLSGWVSYLSSVEGAAAKPFGDAFDEVRAEYLDEPAEIDY